MYRKFDPGRQMGAKVPLKASEVNLGHYIDGHEVIEIKKGRIGGIVIKTTGGGVKAPSKRSVVYVDASSYEF
jgi:hypothetical protein